MADNDLVNQILNGQLDLNSFVGQYSGMTQQQARPMSLAELLVGSAMDVSGRRGQTGRSRRGNLPSWARNLAPEALGHPDFDPYLGVVSEQGDERVYMGQKTTRTPVSDTSVRVRDPESGGMRSEPITTGYTSSTEDRTVTAMQALNLPYTWDEEEVAEAIKKMRDAGLEVGSFDELQSAWGSLVERAAMTYSMTEGKRKLTPWDVLDLYKKEAKASGALFTGNKTTVQRHVTEIDEGEAWANLQTTLSRMLGRDPSDQELRDFTYRMNGAAARNPSISRTVTRFKNGEVVGSNTRTTPGFTAADMAKEAYDRAQNDPEYAEYQSATTYFNAALSALGPIGG